MQYQWNSTFLIVALFEQKAIFDWVAMENNSDWAGLDYFRHIVYAMDRQGLYTHGVDACFPPLADMFYYYIERISVGGIRLSCISSNALSEYYFFNIFYSRNFNFGICHKGVEHFS